MRVKPAEGRAVRDPYTMALLPEDGREVADGDLFWVRRVRDGDVVVDDKAPAHHRSPQVDQTPRREA